ncbi:MAG: uroporphyrinogen-III synthase [Burkholderiaceae bacterium]
MDPLIVLTRPDRKNGPLALRLNDAGLNTLVLPALVVRPLACSLPEFPFPDDYDLIIFVSGNAARFYLDLFAQLGCGRRWPGHTLLATVGQTSAQPLYDAGFIAHTHILHPPSSSQAQDSEALWSLLRPLVPELKRVLVIRGETGREWLGQQLERAGATVRRHAMYRREPARWTIEQNQRIKVEFESRRLLVCLLTSVESVDAVYDNTNAMGVRLLSEQTRFVVIHERVAHRLQSLAQALSGKVCQPTVKICPPSDEAIFRAIVSTISL